MVRFEPYFTQCGTFEAYNQMLIRQKQGGDQLHQPDWSPKLGGPVDFTGMVLTNFTIVFGIAYYQKNSSCRAILKKSVLFSFDEFFRQQ